MKFFDTVADLQPDQCVDGAERAQCASLWHATRWYRETRTAADAIVFATFALKALRDTPDAVAAIQRAAGELRNNDGEATAEQVAAFVEVLMTQLSMNKINPPAQAERLAADGAATDANIS